MSDLWVAEGVIYTVKLYRHPPELFTMWNTTSKRLHCTRVTTRAYVLTLLHISVEQHDGMGERACMFWWVASITAKVPFSRFPDEDDNQQRATKYWGKNCVYAKSPCLNPNSSGSSPVRVAEHYPLHQWMPLIRVFHWSHQVLSSLPLASKRHWSLCNGSQTI